MYYISKVIYQNTFFNLVMFIIYLNENVSLEILNMLFLLSFKYPFFQAHQSETHTINVDLEQNCSLNSNLDSSKILCLEHLFIK